MQNQQDFQQAIQSSVAFLEANGYSVSKTNGLPEADSEGWIKNTGKRPVNGNELVDVKVKNGIIYKGEPASIWSWYIDSYDSCNVSYWRFCR